MDDLAALFTAEYEGCLWVFDELGSLLLYGTLGTSGLGGTVSISIRRLQRLLYTYAAFNMVVVWIANAFVRAFAG